MKKNKIIKNFVKTFFFIILFYLFINQNKQEIFIIKNNYYKNEIIRIEKYKKYCEKGNLKNFNKSDIPKISIVSPVLNRGKYILRFIKSIQNQFFNDIEIIFVDDFSNDNTKELIEECKKIDKRIILIKNKKNKGTLISRNNGALKSKGEYLIFPDPDDILSDDVLNYCYSKAKTHSYDLIKFNLYTGSKVYNLKKIKNIQNKEIYQKELSSYIFYGNGYLKQNDFAIINKFIKRDVFIKSINQINEYYLNQKMIVFEDGLINFMLYKFANSLYQTKKIGYYYIQNQLSITKNLLKDKERTMKNGFIYLKYIFEYTKNNIYEKNIANCIYQNVINEIPNLNIFKYFTKEYKFYYDIINIYLGNKYISSINKRQLRKILLFIRIAEENQFNIKNNNLIF